MAVLARVEKGILDDGVQRAVCGVGNGGEENWGMCPEKGAR